MIWWGKNGTYSFGNVGSEPLHSSQEIPAGIKPETTHTESEHANISATPRFASGEVSYPVKTK